MRTLPILSCRALVALAILLGWSCADNDDSPAPRTQDITCIDAHSQPPYPELGDNVDLAGIIQLMDASNVAVSILSARQEMDYSLDIASLAAAHPDRIIAAVSLKLRGMEDAGQGFLSSLSQQVQSGQFTAIAEMLLYHAEKHDSQGHSVAPEFKVDPSATAVQAVIDAAQQLDCPVVLHIEFESLEQLYGAQERTRFMTGLNQLLAANPTRAFVLTHVAELDPAECRSLIETYDNIYFTTNFMDLEVLMTGAPIAEYSEAEWNALFEDHPDRFTFALERVFEDQWQAYVADMVITQESLAKLSGSVAQAIAYGNAAQLWNIGP